MNSTTEKTFTNYVDNLVDNVTAVSVTQASNITGVAAAYTGINAIENAFEYIRVTAGLVGMVLNMIALILLFRVIKANKTASDILLISQLVIDLISALAISAILPTDMVRPIYFKNNLSHLLMCKLWYSMFIPFLFTNMSMLNCILLTIERYMKIVHPIWHRINITTTAAYVALGISILINAIHCTMRYAISTSIHAGRCTSNQSLPPSYFNVIRIIHIMLLTVAPLVTFIYCYGHMMVTLRKRTKKIMPVSTLAHMSSTQNSSAGEPVSSTKISSFYVSDTEKSQSPADGVASRLNLGADSVAPQIDPQINFANKAGSKMDKAEKNLLKVVVSVGISFLVCNTPSRFYFLLIGFGVLPWSINTFYLIITFLTFLDYSLHPLIYAFTLKKLRDQINSFFRMIKIKCKM